MKTIKISTNSDGAVTLAQSVKLLEQENDETLNLVRRTYPYKLPSNYISWQLLSGAIALGIIGIDNGWHFYRQDKASFLHSHKCALWYVKNHPIYCLKSDLLESMLLTDIHNNAQVLEDLRPNIPGFILLFPRNKLLTTDNTFLDFCIVHISELGKKDNSFGSKNGVNVEYLTHDYEINLHWSAIDTVGTVWFSGAGLKLDGTIEYSDTPIGLSPMKIADRLFLKDMRSMILQVYLLLQYKPEILGNSVTFQETIPTNKGKGFAKTIEPEKVLYPRWLDFQNKTKKITTASNSMHSSPRTHWRRGHWRLALVGEGRKDNKWIWIQPTLING